MRKIFLPVTGLIVFLVIILLLLVFRSPGEKNSKRSAPSLMSTTASVVNRSGVLRLMAKDRPVTVVSEPIVLTLLADSAGAPITGYDLVLNYDSQTVVFKQADNLLTSFSIFKTDQPGRLTVTGYSKPDQQTKKVFKDSPLLKLTFEAKKIGQANFQIVWEKNKKTESNLINDQSEEVLASVEGVTINIGKKAVLTKNQPLKLEGRVELSLKEFQGGKKGCFDCLSYATVVAAKNNQKKEFTFKIGGIAGLAIDHFSQFNYNFYLDSINDYGIAIIYYP